MEQPPLPLDELRLKRCSTCKEVKPLTAFNVRSTARDGRQWNCRACNSAWHREHKEHHNKLIAARNDRIRAEMQRKLLAYLLRHPCVDCGEADPVVLEFDHLRDKIDDIATLMAFGSWERVAREIEKCEVVCANCHRRRTARRRRFYRYVLMTEQGDNRTT